MMTYEQAVALAPTIKGRLLRSLDALERETFDVLQANGAADAIAAYPDSPTSTDERVALDLRGPQTSECLTMTLTLTDTKITALRGALELAREKYLSNAAELRSIPGHERLAEQFDRQAADAEKLLEEIDY